MTPRMVTLTGGFRRAQRSRTSRKPGSVPSAARASRTSPLTRSSSEARVLRRLTASGCLAAALLAGGCGGGAHHHASAPGPPPSTTAAPLPAVGIHKIRHIVVIMQENRSFDSYFGTYPGADGIPAKDGRPTVCSPNPATHGCDAPYHDGALVNGGGDHTNAAAVADVNGGKMDGFVAEAEKSGKG